MELTARSLQRFIGGQIEVRDFLGTDRTRGQIASVQVQGNNTTAVVTVKYAWKARDEGYPNGAVSWVKTGKQSCKLSRRHYTVAESADGTVTFQPRTGGEYVTLHPKGARGMLKRSQVKDL